MKMLLILHYTIFHLKNPLLWNIGHGCTLMLMSRHTENKDHVVGINLASYINTMLLQTSVWCLDLSG